MPDARSLFEDARPAPNWAKTTGVYGDFSRWPRSVDFYVKCPKCGVVHGDDQHGCNFKSVRDAHTNRLCQRCSVEAVNKIKDVVAHVDDPGMTPKGIAKLVGESTRDALLDLGGSWVINAKLELETDQDVSLEFSDDDTPLTEPEDVESFRLKGSGYTEYTVYRNDEVATAAAVAQVKSDLEDSPENFIPSFIKGFIDMDSLRQAIGDPYEDWEGALENKDTPEKIEFLVGEGLLDSDLFYTKNGRLRKVTKVTQQLLWDAEEQYKTDNKPEFDPWEWMLEMHGDEGGGGVYGLTPEQRSKLREANAIKAALKMVNIDYDAAAAAAVRADGVGHFLSSYDGNTIELPDGVVAIRNN